MVCRFVGTPRTPDGKPNLSAPAPRATNGKPDLSGVWQVEPTPAGEMKRLFGDLSAEALGDTSSAFSKYLINMLLDFKLEEAPLRSEFADLVRQRAKQESPLLHCLPIGIPADDLLPGPFKVIQAPGLILVRNEYENTFRQIYTDGRKAPGDPEPLWFGYSGGKWEGNVVERFHRRNFGHLDVEVTIDDPKVYTRPFSVKFTELLLPDSDVTEYFCSENEKDRSHIGGK
jgi:hypothetical protein